MRDKGLLNTITPAQQAALEAFCESCLSAGRSTAPADRATAERIWREMYAALGRPAPRILWVDGPATGGMLRLLGDNLGDNLRDNLGDNLRANLWDNLRANLWDNLWANLGDNLRANLWDNLGANLWDNLWANLGDNLGANLRDNLWANLGDNLGDNLWANLRDNLGDNLWDNLRDNLGWHGWGQHEIYWPAYYLWPHEALRPMYTAEQERQLRWWMNLAQSTGWWEPYEHAVIACERPAALHLDQLGRLHNDGGPALLCRDGWPVYAWHGVRVPARVIEAPGALTAEEILTEPNAEVRRVMMEVFGPERLLRGSRAQRVAVDEWGTLWRLPLADDEPLTMVEVVNATPEADGTVRHYWLRVRPGVTSPLEAIASVHRRNATGREMTPAEYVQITAHS